MKSSLPDKGKVIVGIMHAVQEGGIGIGSSCSADRLYVCVCVYIYIYVYRGPPFFLSDFNVEVKSKALG